MEITASDDGLIPIFTVTPEGGQPVSASTPTAAFTALWGSDAKGSGKAVGRSGAEAFGLLHPLVTKMIHALPNAARCVLKGACVYARVRTHTRIRDSRQASMGKAKPPD